MVTIHGVAVHAQVADQGRDMTAKAEAFDTLILIYLVVYFTTHWMIYFYFKGGKTRTCTVFFADYTEDDNIAQLDMGLQVMQENNF